MTGKPTEPLGAWERNSVRNRTHTITVYENDRVETVNGRVLASQLSVDDIVLDAQNHPCVVEHISKVADDVGLDDAHDGGSRTRFPGVRFVRGRRSEATVYHVILRSLPEPSTPEVPVFKSRANSTAPKEDVTRASKAPELGVAFRRKTPPSAKSAAKPSSKSGAAKPSAKPSAAKSGASKSTTAKPAAESTAKPAAKSTTKPRAKSTTKSSDKPADKSSDKPSAKPAAKRPAKRSAKRSTKSSPKSAANKDGSSDKVIAAQ